MKDTCFSHLHYPKWVFLIGSSPSSDSGSQVPCVSMHGTQGHHVLLHPDSGGRTSLEEREQDVSMGQTQSFCWPLASYWLKCSCLARCNHKGCWEEGSTRCQGKRNGFHHSACSTALVLIPSSSRLFLAKPEVSWPLRSTCATGLFSGKWVTFLDAGNIS